MSAMVSSGEGRAGDGHIAGMAPLPQINVNDAIQDRLITFVRDNHLAAGDRLPSETHLARSLGVGRNAVREALRSLQALGLLEARVGSGWYVREVSLDAVTQALVLSLKINVDTFVGLNQIRYGLETGLFAAAAARLTERDLDLLDELAATMERKAGAGQYYAEEDFEFHRLLFANLDNVPFNRLMDAIWKAYWSMILQFQSAGDPQVEAEEAAKHRAIVAALRVGDVPAARGELERSFERLRRWRRPESDQ